jgi:hypothetical protein
MEGISNDQRRREGSFMGNMAFDKNSKTKVKMVVSPTVEAGDPSRVMNAPLVIQNGQESFEAIDHPKYHPNLNLFSANGGN